jgi:hypothetical protein
VDRLQFQGPLISAPGEIGSLVNAPVRVFTLKRISGNIDRRRLTLAAE